MKRRSRPAAKKAGGRKRKPIMRHSREGVRSTKAKRATRAKSKPKAKARAKSKPKAKKKATKNMVRPRSATKPPRTQKLRRGTTESDLRPLPYARGMGAGSAGQSGDIEALSRLEDDDSESVEELVEEGQAFEAGVLSGVEEADAEPGEVRIREVPVDDVPEEYLDED